MNHDETFNKVDDIYAKLEHDARANPVGDDVMKVTSKEGLAKARDLVNQAIDQGLVSAASLGRRTGIKCSAISAFRNDKWKGSAGTLATTASELSQAINILLRQQESDRTSVDGFIKTQVAETIFNIVKYVTRRRMIGGFALPAGSGKTMALQALHDEIPGSVIVTVTNSSSSVKTFLQAWARALGTRWSGITPEIQSSVIECLIGSDRLVMIDEAHKLSVKCLDVMREIYDVAKIPIIIAGTPALHKTLVSQQTGTMTCDLMDQLYSRIGIFKDFTDMVMSGRDDDRMFSRDDIRRLFVRGGVRLSRDAVDRLFNLANCPGQGGLRICRDLVHICYDLYRGQEITVDLLTKALTFKVGVRQAGFHMDSACGIAATHEAKAVASA